jgi:hypothetical protein
MIQKDTMYIVSSSRNQVFKKILSEKLSLLFGNFEIVKVSGFDAHNARRFVDTRLDGFDIDDPVRKFLIAFTEGNPFYLNHLVKSFKAVASERMSNHISADIAAQAIIDTIYDSSGVIHQYLMNFMLDLLDSKSRDRYMSVLTSVAAGRNKLSSVSRAAKIKQSDASKDLAHLCDLGLLSKNGIFYRIDDPVLAFWIDKVYNKRKNLLVDGIFNRDELFYSQARRYISEFIDESSKDITERVAELFNAFSNDLVQIDSKQLRLPRFTKVETGTFAGEGRYIAATFRGNSWVVCAREEGATESDIVEYIRNVKSLEHKVSNRVLIALGGIDENARLLAKELKISVWDINTLNALLNAYGKNRIAL